MDEKKLFTNGVILIIAAVIVTVVIGFIGIENFDGVFIFLLWGAVGLIATAFGYLVSMIVSCFTEADLHDIIMAASPLLLILLTVIAMINESHSFMGNIGVSVIFMLATVPLILTSVIRTIAAVVKSVKRRLTEASQK